jgi:hypothetical protein
MLAESSKDVTRELQGCYKGINYLLVEVLEVGGIFTIHVTHDVQADQTTLRDVVL